MKLLVYIILLIFFVWIFFWFLLPTILYFFTKRLYKKMEDQMDNDANFDEDATIISAKKKSDAQSTDFEELN